MTEQFWINDHCILFKKSKLMELWPYKSMSYNQQLNATSRFIIIVSLIGYMLMNNYVIILFGVILLLLIVSVHRFHKKSIMENMANSEVASCGTTYNPSPKNPFQNVMMTDYEDSPNKPEVPNTYGEKEESLTNGEVKKFILDNNKDNSDIHKIFGSLGNELDFENSMRNFHINPSTTIPNNQSNFLSFCYKNLYSGKPLNVY